MAGGHKDSVTNSWETGLPAPQAKGDDVKDEISIAYLTWFHNSNVWKDMRYKGIRTLKLPSDMWNYQEILHERQIRFVVETGTRHGGSALFFADHVADRDGLVITCDIEKDENDVGEHPRIRYIIGSSAWPEAAAAVSSLLPPDRKPGETFFIFDSDHRASHVTAELEVFHKLFLPGDTVIVEDTAVNGHPIRPDHGPGPLEGLVAFITKHPGLLDRDAEREGKFGATLAPLGYYRVRG